MKTAAILAVAGAASIAAAQTASVTAASDISPYTPGDTLTVTISLDGNLGADSLGFAGWNLGIDVTGGTVTGASYLTPAAPLIDQDFPFGGGNLEPVVSGNTVEMNNGLNALTAGSDPVFHTGGGLVAITIDTTGASGDIVINTRKGASAVGGFTEAQAAVGFPFSGVEFEDANAYGSLTIPEIPAPASAALLGLGGLVAARRRR